MLYSSWPLPSAAELVYLAQAVECAQAAQKSERVFEYACFCAWLSAREERPTEAQLDALVQAGQLGSGSARPIHNRRTLVESFWAGASARTIAQLPLNRQSSSLRSRLRLIANLTWLARRVEFGKIAARIREQLVTAAPITIPWSVAAVKWGKREGKVVVVTWESLHQKLWEQADQVGLDDKTRYLPRSALQEFLRRQLGLIPRQVWEILRGLLERQRAMLAGGRVLFFIRPRQDDASPVLVVPRLRPGRKKATHRSRMCKSE